MAHTVIGVDLAAAGVKTVMLDASLRKLEFQRANTHPYDLAPPVTADAAPGEAPTSSSAAGGAPNDLAPDNAAPHNPAPSRQARVARSIGEAIAAQRASGSSEMCLGFDGTKTTTHLLRFPMGDLKKIEAILEPELEDRLARPLEEMAYAYTPVLLTKEKGELLIGTAARDEVRAWVAALTDAGQAPRALYAEALSLVALAGGIGPSADQTGALIDIGHSKTHILLMRQGRPVFARTLREGSGRIDRAIAQTMQVDEATARTMKERAQVLLPHEQGSRPDEKRLSEAIEAGLRPLIVALKQTLHLYKNEVAGGRIFLTGGGSLLLGLSRLLSTELGMEATELPLPEPLKTLPSAHSYTLAYALAASSIAPRQPKLDFRRGEFSFRGDLKQLGRDNARLGWAVAGIFLLAMFSGVSRCAVLRADDRALDDTLRQVTKQMMNREISDFKQALVAIRQSVNPEKEVLPKHSALEYFGVVSSRIDPALDLKLNEIDLRQDKIMLKGDAQSYDLIEKMAEGLRGHECFKQVEVGKQHKSRDGNRVEFSVTIDVECGSSS